MSSDPNKGRRGVRTLSEIFDLTRSADITDRELRLWLYYRSWQVARNRNVGATVSDDMVARDLGRSPRAVQATRRCLLEKGLLRQQLRGSRVARYWAITTDSDEPERALLFPERITQSAALKALMGPKANQ